MSRIPFAVVAVVVLASGAFAAPELPSEGKARELLVEGLRKLQSATSLVVDGRVSHQQPARGGMMGGGATVVVGGAGLMSGKPYEGGFQAWRTDDDVLVVVSPRALPGFGLYRSLDRSITQTTFEDDPPSLAGLERELTALLDLRRLARWAAKAQLKLDHAEVAEDGSGRVKLVGQAPGRLVPAGAGGPMGILRQKVLRVDAALVVSLDGRLLEATFTIVRNDPHAGLVRRAMEGGGGTLRPEDLEGDQDDDTEGGRTTYRLKLAGTRPSPRAKTFRKSIETLLEEEDD